MHVSRFSQQRISPFHRLQWPRWKISEEVELETEFVHILSATPNVNWAVLRDMHVWDYPAVVTDIIQRDGSTTWLVQYDNGGKAETTCAGDLHPPLVCGSSAEYTCNLECDFFALIEEGQVETLNLQNKTCINSKIFGQGDLFNWTDANFMQMSLMEKQKSIFKNFCFRIKSKNVRSFFLLSIKVTF